MNAEDIEFVDKCVKFSQLLKDSLPDNGETQVALAVFGKAIADICLQQEHLAEVCFEETVKAMRLCLRAGKLMGSLQEGQAQSM